MILIHNLYIQRLFSHMNGVFIGKVAFCPRNSLQRTMSKKNKTKSSKEKFEITPILYDTCKNVLIRILAKPGAKQNSITDVSEDGIGVQINASPIEGKANTELIKYIATITGVKKSDITILKGSKSRQKTLSIRSGSITVEEAIDKLQSNMETK